MSQALLFVVRCALTVICVELARRMAVRRARSHRAWMAWAIVFGPLPLLILGLLPARPDTRVTRL